MRFVLAGASGFLGTAWRDHLARQGHEVVRLVRGEASSSPDFEDGRAARGLADAAQRSAVERVAVAVDLTA